MERFCCGGWDNKHQQWSVECFNELFFFIFRGTKWLTKFKKKELGRDKFLFLVWNHLIFFPSFMFVSLHQHSSRKPNTQYFFSSLFNYSSRPSIINRATKRRTNKKNNSRIVSKEHRTKILFAIMIIQWAHVWNRRVKTIICAGVSVWVALGFS